MNVNRFPYFIKMTLKHFPEASHSNARVLEKSGIAKLGVLHMACFKMEKSCSTALFLEKNFFLISAIKGVEFLP